MKIKRFNESNQLDISSERIDEMVKDLNLILDSMNKNIKKVESYLNELSNYKSISSKGNDQIDDSISSLQLTRSDLENSIDKVDTVIQNLIKYNEEGRSYIYIDQK